MTTCPKCGGNKILGPRFERSAFGQERLRFNCFACGYSTTTPTLDAKRDPDRQYVLERLKGLDSK